MEVNFERILAQIVDNIYEADKIACIIERYTKMPSRELLKKYRNNLYGKEAHP